MISLLSQLEICIGQRLDQIEMLREDDDERLLLILKEDEKRRQIIRNFRLIRKEEKSRSEQEEALLGDIGRIDQRLTRNQFMYTLGSHRQLEEMLICAVNRYTNN